MSGNVRQWVRLVDKAPLYFSAEDGVVQYIPSKKQTLIMPPETARLFAVLERSSPLPVDLDELKKSVPECGVEFDNIVKLLLQSETVVLDS